MLRLTAQCDGCGRITPQLPRQCAVCAAQCFTVLTEPENDLEIERLEDPDRRPYVWESED